MAGSRLASAAAAVLFFLGFQFFLVAPLAAASLREPLVIQCQDGRTFAFDVELALDQAQREKGLMNRTKVGLTSGMLFDFGEDRRVRMWMKDTLVPLDMLFADRSGKVVHIKENAEPMSLSIIDSRQDVRFVLEVAGGTVDRLSIRVGDRLQSPRIAQAGP